MNDTLWWSNASHHSSTIVLLLTIRHAGCFPTYNDLRAEKESRRRIALLLHLCLTCAPSRIAAILFCNAIGESPLLRLLEQEGQLDHL